MRSNDEVEALDAISFGPFRLLPQQRLLEKAGTPIRVGDRAFDILVVLVERASQIVGRRELVARVWPDVRVGGGSLRFHVGVLRRVLGDGQPGSRYVANVHGHGYCFVAPVSRARAPRMAAAHEGITGRSHNLPPRLLRMVGRDEAVEAITARLTAERFVSIVGPGGIGKTTVAVSVAHALLAEFDDAVRFVDLGALENPDLVPCAVASGLGLSAHSQNPIEHLSGFLRDKRILLVLDCCEHVIRTAAELIERLFKDAPRLHILSTSRESLRIEGEHVHRLLALECPPNDPYITAAEVLSYPAAQLFVERVVASVNAFELTDVDAPIVAGICHKLDGMALALELAASRVAAYGVCGTAGLLTDRLNSLSQGRRTAPPRHQTLSATLDWSHDLLPDVERVVLRRVAVFVGTFALESAQSVAAGNGVDDAQVVEAIPNLVAKSLVMANIEGSMPRYHLLDTTRSYALGKLIDSGEADVVARRHSTYYGDMLDLINSSAFAVCTTDEIAVRPEDAGNLRTALEWSLAQHHESHLATNLAAASGPFFLKESLLAEYRAWTARAIARFDAVTRRSRRELELQTSFGLALMYATGSREEVGTALARGLELAEALKGPCHQMRLFSGLQRHKLRIGDLHATLELAHRCLAVANALENQTGIAIANQILGAVHHLTGNQASAQMHCEVAHIPGGRRRSRQAR